MKNLFFWNGWKKPYRSLYLFLLFTLFALLIVYIITFIAGINLLIDWDIISQFDTVKVPIDKFVDHLFSYSVDTPVYIAKERFFGTDIKIFPDFGPVYLFFLFLGLCVALTVLTRLELSWFAIGMGLFIFLIVFLHLETLGILGESRKFSFIIILVYGAVGFYFQGYDKKLSFLQRLSIFFLITVAFAIIIATLSKVEHPFYYLSNFGIILPLVISIIFIISISFDIIVAFLFISTAKNSSKNSVFQFIFISLLYFINLLLIFLKKKGILGGDFTPLSVFIIYVASTLLGIWGVKRRSILFQNILHFSLASFLYISMAIITTATITYAFVTGNDPLIYMFEYAILYSHMGIGIVFFLYILYNFWELFERNLSPYQLMFKPRRMPFFMVRPLGIVIMISLFLQSNMVPLKHGKAGYFNLQGDVYLSEGKLKEAKEMYTEGSIFSYANLKSNYSLEKVLLQLNENKQAEEYLKNLVDRYPSEFAYANLSNLYLHNDKFFYSWFALRDGLKKFPESSYLQNNLAMLYSTKGLWDSTFYHLDKARQFAKDPKGEIVNLSWLFLNIDLKKEADSVVSSQTFPDYLDFQINKVAVNTINGKENNIDLNTNNDFLSDSILNIRSYAYFYNSVIQNLKSPDTSIIKYINNYIRYESNDQFYFELKYLKALKLYYAGYRKTAIDLLNNLSAFSSQSSSIYYHKVLGLWAIEMMAYEEAASFFDVSNLMDSEVQLYKAIALLEANYTGDGLEIIKKLMQSPDQSIRETAEKINYIYSVSNPEEILNADDSFKYKFMHFRLISLGEKDLIQILNSFSSNEYKLLGAGELMEYYFKNNEINKARDIYNQYSTLVNTANKSDYAIDNFNFKFIQLLENENKWKELIENINKIKLQENKKAFIPYFLASAYSSLGNQKEGEKYFKEAIQRTPLYDQAFIKFSDYYFSIDKDTKAYDVLLQGMKLNPSSTNLLKSYTLASLKLNLTSYAEESLLKLKEVLSKNEFEEFNKKYEKEKAEAEKLFEQY